MGDKSYDNLVITIFKWWFGLAAAFFVGAFIYGKIVN